MPGVRDRALPGHLGMGEALPSHLLLFPYLELESLDRHMFLDPFLAYPRCPQPLLHPGWGRGEPPVFSGCGACQRTWPDCGLHPCR